MKRTIIVVISISLLLFFSYFMNGNLSLPFFVSDTADSFKTTNTTKIITNETNHLVENAVVTNVVDGDTIEVKLNDGQVALVRYIGIDTPEREQDNTPAECFYKEATKRNEELVLGREVTLVRDVSEVDKYGRLLRYVYVGDEFINLKLIKEGLAIFVTFPPDIGKLEEFMVADKEARNNGVGLWSACF